MAKANCFFTGRPEDTAWGSCQVGVSENLAYLVPLQGPSSHDDQATSFYFHGCPPWSIPHEDVTDDRSASASRSHSEAEKRRRDRINAQLATLRKLIPKSEKMDKAALLGSAVEHVKDLKRKATELSKLSTIPGDVDEVTIDYLSDDEEYASSTTTSTTTTNTSRKNNILIRVSFCCDDRPDLFSEINRALHGLKLSLVKADMSSLAGRIRSIFVLCAAMEDTAICTDDLKQSLKLVLSRIVISSTTSNYRLKSKRQRFFLASDH